MASEKTDWKRWPAATPKARVDQLDAVSRELGLTRNGGLNLMLRIALPIARFHAHLLKGNI